MSYESSRSETFLETLTEWIRTQGEILLLIRYSHAAGSREFEFFNSCDVLEARLRELPPKTCVTAFRQPQLPIRGIIDESFIAQCLSNIPDGSEYLVVERSKSTYGRLSWFHHDAGETHAELRGELTDLIGKEVAVGLHPSWLHDNTDVVSAVVPDEHGAVVTGVY